MRFLRAVVLGLAPTVLANPTAARHPAPPLTYLCTIKLTTGTIISGGTVAAGAQLIIPFTGGSFTGPHLNGTIAPVGADFSLTSESGDFMPDGTFVMQTSDGANIIFHDTGHAPYAHATFKTGFENYTWLNTVVGIVVLEQTKAPGANVTLTVFQVCIMSITSLSYRLLTIRKVG
ncbi:hypothetical protein VTI74DRAFT_6773 [Chaetomium olivicolor]